MQLKAELDVVMVCQFCARPKVTLLSGERMHGNKIPKALLVTLDVSPTVFEILMHLAQK